MKQTAYTVSEVRSKTDWIAFHGLSKTIYQSYPHLSPIPEHEARRLLNQRKNPYFRTYRLIALLCWIDDKPAARITIHIPRDLNSSSVATFGFFECIDDLNACSALLKRAENICRASGVSALEGPYNPSAGSISGIQLTNFSSPNVYTEACSPRYYAALLGECGYAPTAYGRTFRRDNTDSRVAQMRKLEATGKYRIWNPNRVQLAVAFKALEEIFGASFANNRAVQPRSYESDLYAALGLLDAWMRDSIHIVYDGNLPVGMIVCLPDISEIVKNYPGRNSLFRRFHIWRRKKSATRLIVYAMGVKEGYRNTAAAYLLAQSFMQTAERFEYIYSTWITEGNDPPAKLADRFGLKPWKRFAMYGTTLESTKLIHHPFPIQERSTL
ncbi:MAG: hypothetical protein CL946_09125 [Ectothiorhodospiraceae bacterium]|nr:hypothetical protein [Ectothiorhodospiraceae bacterium]